MDELDVGNLARCTFIRRIRALDETDSTNNVARAWSTQLSADEVPALVVAESQSAGRGRGENRWWSGPGSLTFSVIVEPAAWGVPSERWPALSLTVGAATALALEQRVPTSEVRLKWPNDVYLDGRKIAGILIESPPNDSRRLVLGIGVNVNNSLAGVPAEIESRAISLCDATGTTHSRTDLLKDLLTQLWQSLTRLGSDLPRLREDWRRLCLLTGRSVVVTDQGRGVVAGTCLGLDDDGALRVQTDGSVERLFSGVVTEFQ